MMIVRRGRAAELKRRTLVRLDVRRIYPTQELSSRYLMGQGAKGEPRCSKSRPMTLIARLKHGIRWLKRRAEGR
jgi:hypothetical protein